MRRTEPVAAAAVSGDLTGMYVGTVSGDAYGASYEAQITATFIHTGDQLAGTWAIFQPVFRGGTWTTSVGHSGIFTGNVSGPSAFIFEGRQMHPCAGVLRGLGAIEHRGTILRGSHEGADCQGTVRATFRVNRHVTVTVPITVQAGHHPPSVLVRSDQVIEQLRAARSSRP